MTPRHIVSNISSCLYQNGNINSNSKLNQKIFLITISAIVIFTFLTIPNYANAGTYYNCANPTGCIPIEEKKPTSDYTATKYPVVLAHGLGGWSRAFGLIEYFHGIPQELIKGGTDVYVTKVSSVHDSEYRGEQLLQQVKTIVAITGKEKLNLVGHSQGGHDIRYVAGVAPNYVASVTAVSSPEQGSKMADWVVKTITESSGYPTNDFNLRSKAVIHFFNFVGGFMDVSSGLKLSEIQQQDGWKAVNTLTTDYMNRFNAKFPAAMPTNYCGFPNNSVVNDVSYYSFSGVGQNTNIFDPSDAAMKLTSFSFGRNDPNDGLVSACSSRLGFVIRDDYHMNHLDSVNQVLGKTSWREANPVSLYRAQINRLKENGL